MAFDDVRLPVDIEQGAVGGPMFLTTVVAFTSGREQRNQEWSRHRCSYDVGYGVQSKDDYYEVLKFFYARRGRARGFRFKDWSDYVGDNEGIATAPGGVSTFQLVKSYSDDGSTYVRTITRPVVGTVQVYVNGSPVSSTLGAKGLVTLGSAPASGAIVSADFEFDVPVRFDVDSMPVTVQWEQVGQIDGIKILEILE